MRLKSFLICLGFCLNYQISNASDRLSINTSQGSFKLQQFEGKVTAHLKGSCLIHDFKGNISWEGKWERVYNKDARSIYKGEGKVMITGHAKAIQFLGRFIYSHIEGVTQIILYPSLIQNNKKNFYKYDKEKTTHSWGAFSLDTLWLPKKQ